MPTYMTNNLYILDTPSCSAMYYLKTMSTSSIHEKEDELRLQDISYHKAMANQIDAIRFT